MSLLSNLSTDSSIADEQDVIGGSRILESGMYTLNIKLAYLTKADSGALALNIVGKTGNQEVRQQFWMTSGTAKGCKNTYQDKDGKAQYLPGFIMANSLCLLTVGKEISQLETEQKVIPLYNSAAKAEVPTKVEMLTDLIGQDILAAVLRQTVDKTAKNAATGAYEPTGETRDENEIEKFFRARDRMTTAEIRAQAETAVFVDTWASKWTGITKNKAKSAGAKGTAGLPGAKASAPVGSSKPASSLFA
jgi:hypothetical protein